MEKYYTVKMDVVVNTDELKKRQTAEYMIVECLEDTSFQFQKGCIDVKENLLMKEILGIEVIEWLRYAFTGIMVAIPILDLVYTIYGYYIKAFG